MNRSYIGKSTRTTRRTAGLVGLVVITMLGLGVASAGAMNYYRSKDTLPQDYGDTKPRHPADHSPADDGLDMYTGDKGFGLPQTPDLPDLPIPPSIVQPELPMGDGNGSYSRTWSRNTNGDKSGGHSEWSYGSGGWRLDKHQEW